MRAKFIGIVAVLGVIAAATVFSFAQASETLRYASSAQVHEAFGDEGLQAFSAETGVAVDLYVTSSKSALRRLMSGYADLASTVERLHPISANYGYREIPFCRAPLAVITNVKTPVRSISPDQLRQVFTKEIDNWKALGGPDEPIFVVVPDKDTGAYANFGQLALRRSEVQYDLMVRRSTWVVKAVKRIPWSISFVGLGVNTRDEAIRTIKIDGAAPGDPNYPYHQIYSFLTKNDPSGPARKLIDFAFSPAGKALMLKNGLTPLDR